mmetsp:Transcript_18582/g.45657  ORF Transcript_18582/g.45657 Transcript_18582/m.45657 type:complete len:365 (+) Transcript_18582:6-1100(+)
MSTAQLKKLIEGLSGDAVTQPFSSFDFYVMGKTLGEGAYGKVKLASHVLTHEKVAVKTFERAKLTEPHARKRVAREIRILKALCHPNIIRLFEVVEHPSRKLLMMQYSSGGDLCRYVREHRRLSEQESCRLFCQIVEGLRYCHDSGIVHRDVKLDNLLIDEHKNIKIVDFGFSVSFKEGQKLRKACGSPSYAAPEIVARRPYSPTGVDVWSSGVVLYAMVCGYFPFQGSNNQELCKRIVKGKFECPSFMSSECKDLVRKMMNVDVSKRISIRGIQEHVWCRQVFLRNSPPEPKGPMRQIDCEVSQSSIDGYEKVEVDEHVVSLVAELGFRKDYIRRCVSKNLHNLCTTSYWVLAHKKQSSNYKA